MDNQSHFWTDRAVAAHVIFWVAVTIANAVWLNDTRSKIPGVLLFVLYYYWLGGVAARRNWQPKTFWIVFIVGYPFAILGDMAALVVVVFSVGRLASRLG